MNKNRCNRLAGLLIRHVALLIHSVGLQVCWTIARRNIDMHSFRMMVADIFKIETYFQPDSKQLSEHNRGPHNKKSSKQKSSYDVKRCFVRSKFEIM